MNSLNLIFFSGFDRGRFVLIMNFQMGCWQSKSLLFTMRVPWKHHLHLLNVVLSQAKTFQDKGILAHKDSLMTSCRYLCSSEDPPSCLKWPTSSTAVPKELPYTIGEDDNALLLHKRRNSPVLSVVLVLYAESVSSALDVVQQTDARPFS